MTHPTCYKSASVTYSSRDRALPSEQDGHTLPYATGRAKVSKIQLPQTPLVPRSDTGRPKGGKAILQHLLPICVPREPASRETAFAASPEQRRQQKAKVTTAGAPRGSEKEESKRGKGQSSARCWEGAWCVLGPCLAPSGHLHPILCWSPVGSQCFLGIQKLVRAPSCFSSSY